MAALLKRAGRGGIGVACHEGQPVRARILGLPSGMPLTSCSRERAQSVWGEMACESTRLLRLPLMVSTEPLC